MARINECEIIDSELVTSIECFGIFPNVQGNKRVSVHSKHLRGGHTIYSVQKNYRLWGFMLGSVFLGNSDNMS